MKIQSLSSRNQGSVLLLSLAIATVIGLALVSYLYLVQGEFAATNRSQAWNRSMSISEAGIEESMAMVNQYVTTAYSLTAWTNNAGNNGWSQDDNVYFLNRTIPGGSYALAITNVNNGTNLYIKSIGTYYWTNGTVTAISRAVLVNAYATSFYQRAVTVKSYINLVGGPTIDSFDSTSPTYSNNGQYDSTRREAHGDIMTVQSNVVITVDVNLKGNAHVYGHAIMGPNDAIQMSGNNATIGDTNYTGSGIQPGWTNSTANLLLPDAPSLPTTTWWPIPSAVNGNYTLSGQPGATTYYQIPSIFGGLSSQSTLYVTNGTVALDVESAFSMSGQSSIVVAPNAKLIIWLNGSSAQLTGGGIVNGSGYATNLTIYGTTNLTSLKIAGNSSFIGTVYAPEANVNYTGSSDVMGSVVGNSFTDSGGANLHYDESLKGMIGGSYIVTSWSEVAPDD